ncbi:hypothetical protein LCGC14_0228730 [marine sediment metagenome]|jgi:hypothetical protein|uniref:Thioredoxin-like fold domain-containing protein n=1 Tax=marine sediment metagenome TaxID=412755 RepID=A0A0F9UFR9_9ZZZZ
MRKKQNNKPSAREREEMRQMRRMLLVGGGCFGAAAIVGVGATLMDPAFPVLPGEGTINYRLTDAVLDRYVLDLTPDEDAKSIVVIGTTDCTYCRTFVKDGLDGLIAYAQTAGLGITYAPIGTSSGSLASTRLLGGFSRSRSNPTEILKAVYAAAQDLGRGEVLPDVAHAYGKSLGLTFEDVEEMLDEPQIAIASRIQATMQAFPVQGTPMFFVANEQIPERINMFSGWSGLSSLRGQIEAARVA